MSFDPTKPTNDDYVLAEELRAQFVALKELIDSQQGQINNLTDRLQAAEDQNQSNQAQIDNLNGQVSTLQNTVAIQQNTLLALQAQLDSKAGQDDLVEQCAGACRSVVPLDIPISNPPSQEQVQDILDNYNTLVDILARR